MILEPTSPESRQLVLSAPTIDAKSLSDKAIERLNLRVGTDSSLTKEEIVSIENLDRRLFPEDFPLHSEYSEQLRVLARFSQCNLRPPHLIASHRRLVGPVIVAVKRIIFPIINAYLKEVFLSIREFNSWLVYSHAQQIHRNSVLEKRLLEAIESLPKANQS